MSNKGNYITSLSRFTAWLGEIAEEMGVEVYPGFAGASLIYGEGGKSVLGVRTNEVGLDRQRRMKDNFEPGMEFRAKVTLLAEGAHGSLTKDAVRKFDLREGKELQTYGIGVKEVWRVDPEKYDAGNVVHTMGWPLTSDTYGGGWVYHMADGMVSLGMVIGLDYQNPYLSPYRELQVRPFFFRTLVSGSDPRSANEAPPLVQGPSLWKFHAPRLRWTDVERGRISVDSQVILPRRSPHRVFGGFRQRSKNQRNPQRDENGHARR